MTGLSPSPRYEFQRPDDRAGVGPLAVYRSLGMGSHPQVQEPHFHVRRTIPAYGALEPLLDNGGDPAAAHLNSNGFAHVDKALAELAYETVRRDIRPSAPSHIDSVFCFFDPLEAFLFGDVVAPSGPRAVCSGIVRSGVPWAIVPMPIPFFVEPPSRDQDGYRQFWETAIRRARIYWNPETPLDRVAEVLVAGAVDLQGSATGQWDTFISAGIVLPPDDLSGNVPATQP